MSDSLRVGVLGAAGTIGPAIVHDLARSEEVASLLLLDLDAEGAERVARVHGEGKVTAARADARQDLAPAISGCDVLVNSASYRANLDVMRACLDAGCHYLDLGGLYWVTGLQLELDAEFRSRDLLAVLGIGSSPGKTNVMARRAVRELDAVERIDVAAASRDPDPPLGFSFPYSLQTLLDEVTMRPVVVRDGRPEEVEPLTAGGAVDFGEPIGEAETIYTLHSELRTFGQSFRCRQASFRLSLPPGLLLELRRLAGAPQTQVDAAVSQAVSPSASTVSVHVVVAEGAGRQCRVTAVTRPMAGWAMGGSVVSTAAPAAAAVRLLARGRIDRTGALPPELCIDPDDLFAELETRACEFRVEVKDEVTVQ